MFDKIGPMAGGFATDVERSGNASVWSNPGLTNHAREEGLRLRLEERARSSMIDLYPAPAYCPDYADAWAAAYIEVGNGHIQYIPSPASALAEYDAALVIAPQHASVIHHDRSVALRIARDEEAATAAQRQSQLSAYGPTQVIPGEELSRAAFCLPYELERQAICWDGTPANLRRILLVVDWNDLDGMWPYFNEYFRRTTPQDDIELVLPSLGTDLHEAGSRLISSLPPSVDLRAVGSVTIERWDNLSYIPVNRFSGVVSTFDTRPQADVIRDLVTAIANVKAERSASR